MLRACRTRSDPVRLRHLVPLVWMATLTACGGPTTATALDSSLPETAVAATRIKAPIGTCEPGEVGYPSNNQAGNHFVGGSSTFPRVHEVALPLDWQPDWVAGIGTESGSWWLATGPAGEMYQVVVNDLWEYTAVGVDDISPVAIPALMRLDQTILYLGSGIERASRFTHPVHSIEGLIYVTQTGELEDESGSILLNSVLTDARPLLNENGDLFVYSDPTSRYDHGVLGDELEAGSLTSLDPATGSVNWVYRADTGAVFEGLAPIVAEFADEPGQEIIVTESNREVGARYVVLSERGEVIAKSDPIGQGYRWQHAIAVAPFAADGELELVGVRTPHLRATVEYYRLEGGVLRRVASLAGYSSHDLGSRNLDRAVAADFDNDGEIELLIPSQDGRSLAAIGRRNLDAREKWAISLDAPIRSNLALACHNRQALAVAFATEAGLLHIMLPTADY